MTKGRNMYGVKLVELAPYELSVFRTLVSSNKVHSIHLVYHFENYMADMVLKEAWPARIPLEDRVDHFLAYMKKADHNDNAGCKHC